jgi:hypothetical protein
MAGQKNVQMKSRIPKFFKSETFSTSGDPNLIKSIQQKVAILGSFSRLKGTGTGLFVSGGVIYLLNYIYGYSASR